MSGIQSSTLQDYLKGVYPNSSVSDFNLLSGGWECDIYAFVLTFTDGTQRDLILRLYLGSDGVDKTVRESSGLYQLRKAGYPVPEILLHETDSTVMGKPFIIMEKLTGQGLWASLSTAEDKRERALLEQFGRLVAQLHQLEWQPFTPLAERYKANPTSILDDLIADSCNRYREFNVDGFMAIADWLEKHKSRIKVQPAVVHLDFHANNVFLHSDDRMTVIDWSQIGVSDYRCDLLWTLMIMGDHGKAHWHDTILNAYRQAAGHPIEDLDYFNVITYTKLLASTIISLRVGPEKLGMRPDSVETMRQQSQAIQSLHRRILTITQITVPEVQLALEQIG